MNRQNIAKFKSALGANNKHDVMCTCTTHICILSLEFLSWKFWYSILKFSLDQNVRYRAQMWLKIVWMEKKCLPIHDLPLWTKFFVTALALYWSVKQYQSELIMSDGPLSSQEQRTRGWHLSWDMVGNNSASTYHSHSVRILGVCPFSHAVHFFPCGWVPNTFENMVASNTAILNFGELAYATR